METFINEYCPPNAPLIMDITETAETSENSTMLDLPFTEEELHIVIKALNKKSSPK